MQRETRFGRLTRLPSKAEIKRDLRMMSAADTLVASLSKQSGTREELAGIITGLMDQYHISPDRAHMLIDRFGRTQPALANAGSELMARKQGYSERQLAICPSEAGHLVVLGHRPLSYSRIGHTLLSTRITRDMGVVVRPCSAPRNSFSVFKALALPGCKHTFNQGACTDLLTAADGSDPVENLGTDADASALPSTGTCVARAVIHRLSCVPGYLVRNGPVREAECMIRACDCLTLRVGLLGQCRCGGVDNRQHIAVGIRSVSPLLDWQVCGRVWKRQQPRPSWAAWLRHALGHFHSPSRLQPVSVDEHALARFHALAACSATAHGCAVARRQFEPREGQS